ncbi:MAG: hotdog fold thioesterase [Rhodothermia bacterium]|nr:hotdog fold thioesterase [Rhodothermia bacterium]
MNEAAKSIWSRKFDLEDLQKMLLGNMTGHLGIEFTEMGTDYLSATMPVDHRTVQPFGILHGGASAALAETLASVAGHLCVDSGRAVAGISINANHVRQARDGHVTGTVRPVHIGRSTQVWRVAILRADGKLICESRVTLAVIDERK